MFNKSTTAKTLTTVLAAAAIIPMVIAVAPAEASAASVTDYVIDKDGVLYAIDLGTYLDMKAGKAEFLQGTSVKYIESSNDKVYTLLDYLDAKAGSGGSLSGALQLLEQYGEPASVDIGQVIVDKDGNVTLQKPESSVAVFEVLSID